MLLYRLKSSLQIVPKSRPVLAAALPKTSTRLASQVPHGYNIRPEPDQVIQDISDYVHSPEKTKSPLARETARLCLIDTIGCGLEALRFRQCTKLLGPVVEGLNVRAPTDVQVPLFRMEQESPERITSLTLSGVRLILAP